MRRISLLFGAGLVIAAVCSAADSITFITQTGFPTGAGFADGPMPHARFYIPRSIAFAPDGSAYIADSSNHLIRRIRKDGWVETAAGTRSVSGSTDGPGRNALFSSPDGVTVDESGNVYVADMSNHTIRKLTPQGMVTTLAGAAKSSGSTDGNGSAARFKRPTGLVFEGGAIYVADCENHTIRKVTLDGQVTTLAGTAGVSGSADGTRAAARFNFPTAIATDGRGALFVADAGNHTIRKVTLDGTVTTVAGVAGSLGSANGPAATAQFAYPADLAVNAAGAIFVTESSRNSIRKIEGGIVSVYAGDMTAAGASDGVGGIARFNAPADLAFDATGNLWVIDSRNHTIRRIDGFGTVVTVAGRASAAVDGPLAIAEFLELRTIARDASGTLYVADGNSVRKISHGQVTTLAGDPSVSGDKPGTGRAAAFFSVQGITLDGSGNILIATYNDRVWKITPDGVASVIAGTGVRGSADGPGNTATFNLPTGIAVDRAGNIFVSEFAAGLIRKIDPAGRVSTFAGAPGNRGTSDGQGSAARFTTPGPMAIDREDNLYVGDGQRLCKITPSGLVSTVGNSMGFTGVSVSDDGTVYVTQRNSVFAMDRSGTFALLAGDPGDLALPAIGGYANGPGDLARFDRPTGLVAHGTTVCVVDAGNNAIRTGFSSSVKRRSVGR